MNNRAQCGTVVGSYQKLSFSAYDSMYLLQELFLMTVRSAGKYLVTLMVSLLKRKRNCRFFVFIRNAVIKYLYSKNAVRVPRNRR